ncbi:Protein of unknown function [Bacillus wiedmannii]|uniref:Uncharacterized protein n=1 Tax=Bacillus wiedmannii TaxID=1890302 RepID=A0A1C4EW78_9BACI|nr:Protein of unknown function [Bacillus wiedmannii]
MQKGDEDRPE